MSKRGVIYACSEADYLGETLRSAARRFWSRSLGATANRSGRAKPVSWLSPISSYRLKDHVQLGAACSCGRGLPVITRVAGRERNMFRFPDGSEVWPRMGSQLVDILAPRRWQVAQIGPLQLEVRYVPRDREATPDYAALTEHIRKTFRQPLEVRYKTYDEIPLAAGGKFHDFICELPAGSA